MSLKKMQTYKIKNYKYIEDIGGGGFKENQSHPLTLEKVATL